MFTRDKKVKNESSNIVTMEFEEEEYLQAAEFANGMGGFGNLPQDKIAVIETDVLETPDTPKEKSDRKEL
jgi:hypothetical protein